MGQWKIHCPGSDLVNELRKKEDRKTKGRDVRIEHRKGKAHLTLDTKNLIRKCADTDGEGWSVLDPTTIGLYHMEDKWCFPLDFGVAKKGLKAHQGNGLLTISAKEEDTDDDDDGT